MYDSLQISKATKKDLPHIRKLLSENDLPTEDLTADNKDLYVIFEDELIACGGVERWGDNVLLRSLAVADQFRGKGLGKRMLSHLIHEALNMDTREIFLLTETAYSFFHKHGFEQIHREQVPASIRSSREYSELSSENVLVMKLKK